MPTTTAGTATQATRDKLLDAAVEVFAQLGYRDATLREICRRAGANNAAINYHFRDKEHLYREVIERVIQEMRAHVPHSEAGPSAPPEEKLGSFVRTILREMLGEGPPTWLMRLLIFEMIEPTRNLDLVVERVAAPVLAELASIVRELTGPSAAEPQVFDCAVSVLGQCVEYHRMRPILARLGPYKVFDETVVEHLADHITRFSLAGIRALAAPGGTSQQG